MKGFALYAAACVIIVALVGAIAWAFVEPAARQALVASAGLTVAVQLVSFGIARGMQRRNLMVGWGLGSLLRLVALVLYAVVVARLWRASLTPALLSFVTMLFVTTIVEPIFLRYR